MTGPFVQIAALCEQVLEEKDGVNSLIRVIDRTILKSTVPIAPGESIGPAPPATFIVHLVLVAGSARGSHLLSVWHEEPSGLSQPVNAGINVSFDGRENSMVRVKLTDVPLPSLPGLHWIDVKFGDEQQLLARIPWEIQHQFEVARPSQDPQ